MSQIRNDKGFFFVRKRAYGFAVYYEIQEENNKSQIKIERHQWLEFGFDGRMTIEQAKDRCKTLNKERKAVKARLNAERRATGDILISNHYFPEELIERFKDHLRDNNLGSDRHLSKVYSHFHYVQKMVTKLNLQPRQYADNSKKIFRYLIEKRVSVDYANKIINILNRYGQWYSRTTQSYYQQVPKPRGNERFRIEQAQEGKGGVRVSSKGFTPEQLKGLQLQDPKVYNWVTITLWFGLRPNEVQTDNFEVVKDISGIDTLHIFMTKVKGTKQRRTKVIPILFDEQKEALTRLVLQDWKKPSAKVIKQYFGEKYDTYSGRKGFTDLMLGLGQKIEHISVWLGHKDISTTWTHYKDRETVKFTPVKKKA